MYSMQNHVRETEQGNGEKGSVGTCRGDRVRVVDRVYRGKRVSYARNAIVSGTLPVLPTQSHVTHTGNKCFGRVDCVVKSLRILQFSIEGKEGYIYKERPCIINQNKLVINGSNDFGASLWV